MTSGGSRRTGNPAYPSVPRVSHNDGIAMICPECGSDYREGFTRCADCDVDLVEGAGAGEQEEEQPDLRLVKIYEGGNAAVLPLVGSLLRDAGIEFMTRGEALQDLFALGRFGTGGGSNVIGPVEFWVREEDEAAARELLAGVDESTAVAEGDGADSDN